MAPNNMHPCLEVQHSTRNGIMCCVGLLFKLKALHPDVDFKELQDQLMRINTGLKGCRHLGDKNG